MVPDKLIDEFVARSRQVAEPNLQSIVLYGSAASGAFDAEFSNINLLCVLKDSKFPSLQKLAPVMEWWHRKKQVAPLIMSKEELGRSTDIFSIELLDMKRNYRILFGEDVLQSLAVRMDLHRVQVEYELREKLLLLRQSVLVSARDKNKIWDLLLGSVASFTTLFRHSLVALGEVPPDSKRESVVKLAARVGFNAAPFSRVLGVREHKLSRKDINVEQLCAEYLAAVEQVTAAVDKLLDAGSPGYPKLSN
jgi:predicted nucleotidyltransferase